MLWRLRTCIKWLSKVSRRQLRFALPNIRIINRNHVMMPSADQSCQNNRKARGSAFRPQDIALIPLFFALPLMYWPKILEGDTQPWVAIAAAISFVAYWPKSKIINHKNTLIASGLALLSLAIYFARDPNPDALLRYGAVMIVFILLWSIFQRAPDTKFVSVVRLTIVVWFLIGLYQVVAIRLGLPIEFDGRYVASRSGVPGLTAESSFYGTISVIQIMYLITEKSRKNNIYIILAAASVLMSGSAIALLLLIVPIFRLRVEYKIVGFFFVLIFVISGYDFLSTGLFNRFQSFEFSQVGVQLIERDASTNLRFGHIVFTLYHNIINEILYFNSISFEREYNNWAYNSNLFIYNESDNILTMAGELVFRSGAVGLALVLMLLHASWSSATLTYDRIEKLAFVALCLLNPINLANPFLILYIQKKYSHNESNNNRNFRTRRSSHYNTIGRQGI